MKAIQYLEDLFVKFQRLNQILKDNWSDNTQKGFDNNYLTPIATEWSMYHSSAIDLNTRIKTVEREISEGMNDLTRQSEQLRNNDTCLLNNSVVYSILCRRDGHKFQRHFLVDFSEINHLDEEDLIFMASGRFPSVEEFDTPALVESILIR